MENFAYPRTRGGPSAWMIAECADRKPAAYSVITTVQKCADYTVRCKIITLVLETSHFIMFLF